MPSMPTGPYTTTCSSCVLKESRYPVPESPALIDNTNACWSLSCECLNPAGKMVETVLDLCTCPRDLQKGFINNVNGRLLCGRT